MKTLFRLCTIAVIFLFPIIIVYTLNAKVLSVDLQTELNSAKNITFAKVIKYGSNELQFEPLEGPARIRSAKYSSDPDWNPSRFIMQDWDKRSKDTIYTAQWPPVGAEVLIVVDQEGIISLFARKKDETYRFWSTQMTGSVAAFKCNPPAAPVELIDEYNYSWDGCFLSAEKITFK